MFFYVPILLHKEAKKRVFLQGTYLLNNAGRGHPVKDVSPDWMNLALFLFSTNSDLSESCKFYLENWAYYLCNKMLNNFSYPSKTHFEKHQSIKQSFNKKYGVTKKEETHLCLQALF